MVEVRLEELGARLRFLFEMVRALHRLDKHICRRKVQWMPWLCGALILLKLLTRSCARRTDSVLAAPSKRMPYANHDISTTSGQPSQAPLAT